MADELFPVAGMKIYIGGVLAPKATDFIESDFASQSWILIDGWETCGAIGDTVNEINVALINRGRDLGLKGTAAGATQQHNFAILASDPGQIALIAAGQASKKSNYAFKVEGNESGVSAVSQKLFVGLVMGTQEQGGSANTARLMQASIKQNSNIVSVAAVPV